MYVKDLEIMPAKKAAKSLATKPVTKAGTKAAGESRQKFKTGERVTWTSSGGASHGKVVRVATSAGKIKDFEYQATKEDPRYIVETDDGKHAAHKASGLKKA